jgi:tRNA A37 threonylcarbamoyladenosine synthetase subunit TsaC/SUA5/YrdC
VNPLDSNTITGRAWCEVVVQRLPEYIDSTSANQEAWRAPSTVSDINQQLGRRFQVISFRWLSPEDI